MEQAGVADVALRIGVDDTGRALFGQYRQKSEAPRRDTHRHTRTDAHAEMLAQGAADHFGANRIHTGLHHYIDAKARAAGKFGYAGTQQLDLWLQPLLASGQHWDGGAEPVMPVTLGGF